MIPVTQTKFATKDQEGKFLTRGNCYPAVIASMMELKIDEVPNVEVFYHLDDGFDQLIMHTFLNSNCWELISDSRYRVFHNFDPSAFKVDPEEIKADLKDQLYLVSGLSPRDIYHICIYKNGELVHDPHPSGEGLKTFVEFFSLENTND